MPLGAARITLLAKTQVVAVPTVIRRKKGIQSYSGASVSTTQSKFGSASAQFSGNNQILQVASDDFRFGTGDFTIEGWVRVDGSKNQGMFHLSTSSNYTPSNSSGLAIAPRTNSGGWVIFSNGQGNASGVTPQANVWYHVALQRSNSTLTFYLDGNDVYSKTDTNDFQTQYLAIGHHWNYDFALDGNIDEFRISKVARYTANFTPATTPHVNDDDTLLLLHMDGTDGSTYFEDDNGVREKVGVSALGNAQVSTSQSKFGGASLLNNITSGLDVPGVIKQLNWSSSDDFTYEGWYYATSTPSDQYFFDSRNSLAAVAPMLYSSESSVVTYYTAGAPRITVTWDAMWINTWIHIAVVRNSGTTTLYIEGTNRGSFADTFDYINSGIFKVGNLWSSNTNGFPGLIDEFRISNVARYTANFTPPTEPFVNDSDTTLLLHMDGTDGSTVFDDDNGVRSKVGVSAVGNAQIDTAQSKFGGSSLLLDGTGDYLEIVDDSKWDFNQTDATIECWFRGADVATDINMIASKRAPGGSNEGYQLYVSNGTLSFNIIGGTGSFPINGTTSVSNNTWYHAAIVKQGSTFSLYLDGALEGSSTGTMATNATNLWIGRDQTNATRDFNGNLDEFRISSTARYTSAFTPQTEPFQNDANTLLLLHMDGTDGSTVFRDDNGVTP